MWYNTLRTQRMTKENQPSDLGGSFHTALQERKKQMASKTVSAVLEAEKKAEETRRLAEEQAGQLLAQAEEKARLTREEIRAAAREKARGILAAGEEEARQILENAARAAEQEAAALSGSLVQKEDRVRQVLDEISGTV